MTTRRPTRADVRAKFEAGDLTWKEAFALLSQTPKPWETSEWKRRRSEVLKDKCEECGASSSSLYLQHHWHPSTFRELCEMAKDLLRDDHKLSRRYEPPRLAPFDSSKIPPQRRTERNCCPRCESVNIRYHKTYSTWRCYARRCGTFFETPSRKMHQRFEDSQWIERYRHNHVRPLREYDRQWEQAFVQSCREEICKLATALSFREHDRYVEMRPEDIRTLCKKCAYKEDGDYSKGRFGKEWARSKERLRQILKAMGIQL